jgi:protocatechuate 3,4-dioxygenase beta subunit
MRSQHFSTLLAVFALTIALAGRAEASCPFFDSRPPCEAYWSAQAVFVGTVKEEVYSDIYQRGEGDFRWNYRRRITRFSVETAYKGVEGKLAEVVNEEIMPTPVVLPNGEKEIRTVSGYVDCDHTFDVGETYFVYANFSEEKDGTLVVGRNRTGKLEDAAADLKYVNALPRAAPTVRIFGHIVRTDLSGGKDKGELMLPLAGIKVTARSGKRTFEALTDARGKYELKNLPPGNYQVTPAYPAHLSASDGSLSARVSARGCAELNFYTKSDVSLKGRVLDAEGRPLPRFKVALIEADGAETTPEVMYTFTDQEGHYWLTGIPTGRYLLFFNLSLMFGERSSRPRTYYPGVWSEAQATVITVVEGENLPAHDIQLLPPPAERAVEIVVTWPDGRPVGNAYLYLEHPDYERDGSPTPFKKVDGREGHYQVTGFDGLTYWAHAHVNFGVGQMHAEPVKFTLTEGAGTIKLVTASPGGLCTHYRRK